ncbi:hypothetical protein RFI02_13050 [Acinetobacter sichuanensis]|uniref:hypothetical protein n=1 Tax=Acinetobacter sichuanensis TaxID=2136183 RepID=UPI0028100C9A|nr:hypothetical protein [Acinetobacter sichuanensis]MDQ9022029.1 hypothetical protein [Acinetobacter sichuanensis]
MEDKPVLFDSYQDIVTNYITSFEKANTPFSVVCNGKENVNFKYLEKFLNIIGIELTGQKFHSLTKIILSAQEGRVLYYDYLSFKPLAHFVLDRMPEFWTHFRLVLKTYQHQHLIQEVLADAKIQKKLKDKASEIDHPNHQYNEYIEFLCPKLDGKLIAWGLGEELNSTQSNVQRQGYPINILKNFLKDQPQILHHNVEQTLFVLQKYFMFKFDIVEFVRKSAFNVFFDFIVQNFKDQQGYLDRFYGDYGMDLMFKAQLNPIIEVLDLTYLIDDVAFADNCCTFSIKDSVVINYDLHTETGWENQNNKEMLCAAIAYCEQMVKKEESYFFIEKVNFY